MDAAQYAKIEASVDECLNACLSTDRPYVKLTAFIETLRADGWSDQEVVELQTRVIRTLLYQQRKP